MMNIKKYESFGINIKELMSWDNVFDISEDNIDAYISNNINNDNEYYFKFSQVKNISEIKKLLGIWSEIGKTNIDFEYKLGERFINYNITFPIKTYEFQKWLSDNKPERLHYVKDYLLPDIKKEYAYLFDSHDLGLF